MQTSSTPNMNVELQVEIDREYQPALSIPVDMPQVFSLYPLKWLRYLGFTIIGTQGYISTSPRGPEVEYRQATIQPITYYYVTENALLLDPDMMDEKTSDSGSIGRGDFREKVVRRDGTCVMTGANNVQACHIIPHAKGPQYMINLVSHRQEHLDPPLNNIHDIRNGILLAVQLYKPFRASQVAFLRTPNFAMDVDDVELVMQPDAEHLDFPPTDPRARFTFQHFNNSDKGTARLAPHNSDARQSVSNWPPSLMFDVAYGCAALNTWGVPPYLAFARRLTKDIYYDDGDNRGGGSGSGGEPDDGGRPAKQSKVQVHDHAARAAKRDQTTVGLQANTPGSDTPDFAAMIMALHMYNARKAQHQAHVMKVDRTREKVQTWLDSADS